MADSVVSPAAAAPGTTASSEALPTNQPDSPLEQLEVEEINDDENEQNYPQGPRFIAAVAALFLTLILIGLDLTIVATAMPSITDHFKTTADIGWYSSVNRLMVSAFLFMFGKIYTLYSIKRVFLISIVIFEVGSLLCTLAPTSKVLILGRGVAGLGCSGILCGVMTILPLSVPLRKRPLLVGIGGAVETFASVIAPVLGGVLTDKVSWRACFGINLPLGTIAFGIVAIFYQNPRPNPDIGLPFKEKLKRLDLPGTAIFVPSLMCLFMALQWGGATYGWGNARIIVLLVVFILSLFVFGWIQYRQQDNATLPPRILKQRSIIAGAWFAGCSNASAAVVEYYISIYFQGVKGYSATKSGLMSLPLIIGLCLACLLAGVGTTAIGYYTPLMFLSTVLGSIAAGLLTTLRQNANMGSIIAYLALLGFGTGIGIQQPQVAAQTVLSPKDVSIGIAVVQFGQNALPAVMISAAQTVFQTRLRADLSHNGTIGANVTSVVDVECMGLSDLRKYFGGKVLSEVLLGYDEAVTQTLYLPVALSCLMLLGSVGMEWRSVKKKQS